MCKCCKKDSFLFSVFEWVGIYVACSDFNIHFAAYQIFKTFCHEGFKVMSGVYDVVPEEFCIIGFMVFDIARDQHVYPLPEGIFCIAHAGAADDACR